MPALHMHLQRPGQLQQRMCMCSCLVFAVLLLLLLQAEFGRLDVLFNKADGGQGVAGHSQLYAH
jgi:hypothetical protein